MKTLLVMPPAEIPPLNIKNITPPLGMAYVGAGALAAGHQVRMLDCQVEHFKNGERVDGDRVRIGISSKKIARRIREFSPEVVAVSCPFSTMTNQAKHVLRIAKSVDPDIVTVFGGLHASLFPEDPLSEPAVDIVAQGHGDRSFPDLLDTLAAGGDPASVPGMRPRGPKGKEGSAGPPPPFLTDLDELPFPAWRYLPMESYFSINFPHGNQVRTTRIAPVLSSRGCPFECAFCMMGRLWKRRMSFRSPENVVREIEFLVRTYGIKEVHFEDDNLTIDRKRAMELFGLMAEKTPGLFWNAPGGLSPTTLDDELLAAMAHSGCYEVNLAVESGSERVLTKIMGKTNFLADLPRIVSTCRRLGIMVHGFFVLGVPGETVEEVEKTLRLPARLGFTDAFFCRWIPLPGTKLYEAGIEQGVIRPEDVSYWTMHMSGRVPRKEGISLDVLESLIARANWRTKLHMLVREPGTFYQRYGRVILRNPFTMARYLADQLKWSVLSRRGGKTT